MSTKIEWADLTINPTAGCMKCSPGCANCYAERFASRLAKNPQTAEKYVGVVDDAGKWTGRISEPDYSVFERLPKKPQRVFLGSMTDLFFRGVNDFGSKGLRDGDGNLYEFVPDTMHVRIARLLLQISKHKQHTFMMLTKRPDEMKEVLNAMTVHPLLNLWVGVTVCNHDELWKLDVLQEISAAKRFVSFEPLLEDVGDISKWVFNRRQAIQHLVSGPACLNYEQADDSVAYPLDWVICGGETGHGARPVHPAWVRSLRDQCHEAMVPFFFKSWGEFTATPRPDATYVDGTPVPADAEPVEYKRVGKKCAGRLLDGVEYSQFPEV